MISDPRPIRRRIVMSVIGVCAALVLVGVFLPSSAQRRLEEKRQKLVGLKRVAAPELPKTSVKMDAFPGVSSEEARTIVIHVYLEIGKKFPRADLMMPMYSSSGSAKNRTVLHIRFDPKDAAQIDLASAIAASANDRSPAGTSLRMDAFVTGRTVSPGALQTNAAAIATQKGKLTMSTWHRRLREELASGGATALPIGTVLYEVDGRFYREPPAKAATTSVPYTGFSTGRSEVIDALGDPRIALP